MIRFVNIRKKHFVLSCFITKKDSKGRFLAEMYVNFFYIHCTWYFNDWNVGVQSHLQWKKPDWQR